MSLQQQIGLTYPNPPVPPPPSTIGSPSQLLMSSASPSSLPTGTTSCCENGRPIMTDPHTGQTVCSCQYGTGLLSAYSRVPGLTDSVYSSTPYGSQGYMSALGTDPSAFYSPLNSQYGDLKDNINAADAWRSITQPGSCYPYDPAMASYPYGSTYGGMDLNGAARRKNATRETTNTLKAWLYEHRKNPYPTKGEKIMLAIITKMTLTQVSTWFANARRRLKKENKMTWSPRNRCGDGDDDENSDKNDDDDDDNEKDKDKLDDTNSDKALSDIGSLGDDIKKDKLDLITRDTFNKPDLMNLSVLPGLTEDTSIALQPFAKTLTDLKPPIMVDNSKRLESPCSNSSDSGLSDVNSSMSLGHTSLDNPNDPLRPRIWSIANVVTTTSSTSATSPSDVTDHSMPLNFSRVGPSSFAPASSTSTVRPWMESVFPVGSSMFAPNNGYTNLGNSMDKSSLSSTNFNGLTTTTNSTSSLLRPYPPPMSSMFADRDMLSQNDRIINPIL